LTGTGTPATSTAIATGCRGCLPVDRRLPVPDPLWSGRGRSRGARAEARTRGL